MRTDGRNDAVYQIAGKNYEKLLSCCEALNDEGYWEEPASCLKRKIDEMLDLYVQSVLVSFAVYSNRLNEAEQKFIHNITNNCMISWDMNREVPASVISGAKRVSTSPPILLQLCGLRDKEKSTQISGQFFDAFVNIILSLSHINHGLRYKDIMAKEFLSEYFEKVQYFLDEAQSLVINEEYLRKKTENDRIEDVYAFNIYFPAPKKEEEELFPKQGLEGAVDEDGFEWEDTEVDFSVFEEIAAGSNPSMVLEELLDRVSTAVEDVKNNISAVSTGKENHSTTEEKASAAAMREDMGSGTESVEEDIKDADIGAAGKAEKVKESVEIDVKGDIKEETKEDIQEKQPSAKEQPSANEQLSAKGQPSAVMEEQEEEKEEKKEEEKPPTLEEIKRQQKENFLNHKLEKDQVKAIQEEIKAIKEKKSMERVEGYIKELNQMVGLTRVKDEVKSLVNLIRMRKLRITYEMPDMDMSYHMVFTGNPGTGKTTVARLLAKIYKELGVVSKGTLVETDRAGLVAGYVGQTALKVTEVVNKAIGGILFIDEAYSLTNSSVPNDFGTEAIDTLVKLMEDNRNDLVVIVAGYKKEMKEFLSSNTGLISRFNKFIEFPDYELSELIDILEVMSKNAGVEFEENAIEAVRKSLSEFSEEELKLFGNARGIRNTFEKIIQNQANRIMSMENPAKEDLVLVKEEDVKKVLKSN